MTPGQARIALSGFLLLTAGVAINALYLQSPLPEATAVRTQVAPAQNSVVRKPSPSRPADKAQKQHPVRTAVLQPDSAHIDQLPVPSLEADAETVRAIQRELDQRGYGPLTADGIVRVQTRAAILAYEYDQGQALTGEATEALLKRILLGQSAVAEAAGAPRVRSSRAEQLIRSVQQALIGLGYQPGKPDGQLGEDTSRAIREFELDKGLIPKGRVSVPVMQHLTEAAAHAQAAGR